VRCRAHLSDLLLSIRVDKLEQHGDRRLLPALDAQVPDEPCAYSGTDCGSVFEADANSKTEYAGRVSAAGSKQ
jgi:hypothetical protein